jgi:hypothetical protein
VSSSSINSAHNRFEGNDWAARLIPGVAVNFRGNGKKPPQSLKPPPSLQTLRGAGTPVDSVKQAVSESARTFFLPYSLTSRSANIWIRSIAADFAAVGLVWSLIAALTPPLHALFPRARVFEHPLGSPALQNLLGLALLHGALITLVGCCEGLYGKRRDFGPQARALGRAVLWATAVLSLTYRLQGAPIRLIAIVCVAACFHFMALLAWRWKELRSVRRTGHPGNEVRNVLIVGAGGVGRRVAAHLEQHPEEGRVVCGFLDDERPTGDGVIGAVNNLARLARTGFVDEVILAAPRDRALVLRVLHEAQRLRLDVEIVPDLFGCKPQGGGTERIGDLPIVCLHAERPPAAGLLVKRTIDIAGASAALGLSIPGGDRGPRPARFRRLCFLCCSARRTQRPALPLLQIPHHGEQCRRSQERPARRE